MVCVLVVVVLVFVVLFVVVLVVVGGIVVVVVVLTVVAVVAVVTVVTVVLTFVVVVFVASRWPRRCFSACRSPDLMVEGSHLMVVLTRVAVVYAGERNHEGSSGCGHGGGQTRSCSAIELWLVANSAAVATAAATAAAVVLLILICVLCCVRSGLENESQLSCDVPG